MRRRRGSHRGTVRNCGLLELRGQWVVPLHPRCTSYTRPGDCPTPHVAAMCSLTTPCDRLRREDVAWVWLIEIEEGGLSFGTCRKGRTGNNATYCRSFS